jgi:glycosyltransferase involved in cell wall biosynthesis
MPMTPLPDVVCLSHLRWGFVYQRPNHLLSRCARERRVFFVEEPVHGDGEDRIEVRHLEHGLHVVVPHLREGTNGHSVEAQRSLLAGFFLDQRIERPVMWLYTPMALPLVPPIDVSAVVYDCMDELSAFHGASSQLSDLEGQLFRKADLVFTGGQSLYEAKRAQHRSVHAFPSSVEAAHFGRAREPLPEPADQATIPKPRVGFFGVIDERMDLGLLDHVAEQRPNVHFVMIGPVVKIDPATLPLRANIHWLGQKTYAELPSYLAGWDVAMMPFALNDATRFISPTKTLEYMAAGKPVVSTAIRDVVAPYGERGVVRIADRDTFAAAVDGALLDIDVSRRVIADGMVAATSWDRTWTSMSSLLAAAVRERATANQGTSSCSTI